MNVKVISGIVAASSVIVLLIYDLWAFTQAGTEGTLSWAMCEWSYKYPIFPLIVGIVVGHLFWQMKNPKDKK